MSGAVLAGLVPEGRRGTVGVALRGIAVTGAVASVLLAVLGWQALGRVDAAVDASAEVTASALTSVEDSLAVAQDVLRSVDGTLVAVEAGLATTRTSLADGSAALVSVSDLANDAAPALASATATLRSLEEIGAGIDAALSGLSRLPFAPEYDPSGSFGTTVGQLADDLEPLGESFARTASDLDDVAANSGQLDRDLLALADAVGDAAGDLDASRALVERYLATAAEAEELATAGADLDLGAVRWLLLVAGLAVAAGQYVPWLLGTALLAPDPSTPEEMS